MKTTKAIVLGAMILGIIGSAGAGEAPAAGKADEAKAVKAQSTCPVMGGAINKAVYVDYEGKRIYFCCGGCPAEFKKDPAKYLKKMEKDGVTLDKAPEAPGGGK